MENGEDEDDINETKARDLVYYLLENDTSVFKKLIPQIRAMDSNSFKNLFKGNPFKRDNNEEGYDYHVHNRKQFERLLDKFDNFWIILDEWYLDEKYYKYLKDLWTNYISIENLQKKDEKGRELLLKSYDIDYSNWPKYIKDDFRKKINNTKKTRILDQNKKPEYKKNLSDLKNVIKQLKLFKRKIENEPEMEIYEENTDNIIKKIKTNLYELRKKYGKSFADNELKKIFSLGSLCYAIPFFKGIDSANLGNVEKKKTEIKTIGENEQVVEQKNNKSPESNGKSLKEKTDFDKNLDEQVKALLENKFFFWIYVGLSFLNLGWSVWEFICSYKDLKVNENLKQYEVDLKTIEKSFKGHKEQIGILPDDSKEALEKIKEVFKYICEDYNKLRELISKIHNDIKIAKNHKDKSTFGLISSGVLGIIGIVGGVFIKNGNSFWYGIGTLTNAFTAIGHTEVIFESNELIGNLYKLLDEAKAQEKKILEEMENLINLMSDMEKGLLPKYKQNTVISNDLDNQ